MSEPIEIDISLTPAEARSEAQKIIDDREGAYWNPMHRENKSTIERVTALFTHAEGGEQPVIDEFGQSMEFHRPLEDALAPAESEDAYDFQAVRDNLPPDMEWDGDFEVEARAWMHEAGVSIAEGNALAERYREVQMLDDVAIDRMYDETKATLKRTWGADYERNLVTANATINALGPAFKDFLLNRARLGNDHATIQTLYRIGSAQDL